MAESPAFSWICRELENGTDLDRLEARGTIRLALKTSGLDASTVLPEQMCVVIEKVLPGELDARGVASVEEVCARLAIGISRIDSGGLAESPDQVFRRLGGD